MLVHIEFRVYLFYYTSHLYLGSSDPFYHIYPLLSCLCLGSQCLEIRGCLELQEASSSYGMHLHPVAFAYAHPAHHIAGNPVCLCFSMAQLPSLLIVGQYHLYPLCLAVIDMQVQLKNPGFDDGKCFL